MTEAMEKAATRALSLVGNGYIYGAKGQKCSLAFRQQQAAQYPAQAEYILGKGAKWDGKPVWDCAQLTRTSLSAAGISLVSGATSQWKKGPWLRKGEIDVLPREECALVFRQKGEKMSHTGLYLGDGTVVDARGTVAGVVRQPLEDYGWTHWASPWEAESTAEPENQTEKQAPPQEEISLKLNRQTAEALLTLLQSALTKEEQE